MFPMELVIYASKVVSIDNVVIIYFSPLYVYSYVHLNYYNLLFLNMTYDL